MVFESSNERFLFFFQNYDIKKQLIKTSFSINHWKCLEHRSAFRHQIAAALAACYIAFLLIASVSMWHFDT